MRRQGHSEQVGKQEGRRWGRWGLAGLVAMATAAVLSGEVRAADFDLPAWSQILPAAKRFLLVMGNAAVLDKETGLVWEQSPVTTAHSWNPARFECTGRTTGGRKGWRLPSVHELASLMDPNNPSGNPNLPPGHPFSAVQSSDYWSATTVADGPGNAWLVNFSNNNVATNPTANTLFVWCVRGGMNADAY